MTRLLLLLSRWKMWLAIAAGFIVALGVAFLRGYRAGMDAWQARADRALRRHLERIAELQKRYQQVEEPDDVANRLDAGKFLLPFLAVLLLGACAPHYELPAPALACPVPEPIPLAVQKAAAHELRACGDKCRNIRRVLRAAAKDRERMRLCNESGR